MLGFSISILTLTSHSYDISLTMSKSHPYQNPLAAYCRRGSWGIILRNSHCVWMWLFPHKIMNLRSLEKGFCQIFSLIWQVTSNGCYLHLNWLISIQKIDIESSKSGLKCHCQSDVVEVNWRQIPQRMSGASCRASGVVQSNRQISWWRQKLSPMSYISWAWTG